MNATNTGLIAAALLVLASCYTGPQVTETIIDEGDGVLIVDTMTLTATVAAINPRTREITLSLPDGTESTFKAGEEAVNFDQIAVGDIVEAEVAEELAVSLIEEGAPPSVGAAAGIALAPKGEKPAVVMVDTVEVTATIRVVDPADRKLTLEFVDGSMKTVKVARGTDLTNVVPGESLRVQLTEAVAISVSAP
jgi:hypothetical protein